MSVIAYYLNGHSYKQTAKQFNLPTDSIVERWVKLYQTHGIDGIKRRNTKASKNKSKNKAKPQDDDYTKLLKRLAYLEAEYTTTIMIE